MSEKGKQVFAILFVVALLTFFLAILSPVFTLFIPVSIGGCLLWGTNRWLEEKWEIPSGQRNGIASWKWTILTGIEIVVSAIIILMMQVFGSGAAVLIVSLIIYIVISIVLLKNENEIYENKRHKKTVKRQEVQRQQNVANQVRNGHTVQQASIHDITQLTDTYEYSIYSVDGMEGHSFEYFCAEVLRKNGFTEVSVTKGSGDQGVDVLATKSDVKYAIQCKNYASPLGNTPIQEVCAGKLFYNCHVGVVMTNSTFTSSAQELAKATGVLIWDRAVLEKMMVTAFPCRSTEPVESANAFNEIIDENAVLNEIQ